VSTGGGSAPGWQFKTWPTAPVYGPPIPPPAPKKPKGAGNPALLAAIANAKVRGPNAVLKTIDSTLNGVGVGAAGVEQAAKSAQNPSTASWWRTKDKFTFSGLGSANWFQQTGKWMGRISPAVTFVTEVSDPEVSLEQAVLNATVKTATQMVGTSLGAAAGEVVCFGVPICGVAGAMAGAAFGTYVGEQILAGEPILDIAASVPPGTQINNNYGPLNQYGQSPWTTRLTPPKPQPWLLGTPPGQRTAMGPHG
jgi:hypothetical protein